MNLIDLIFIAYLALYIWATYRRGFIRLALELVGLLASFALALFLYPGFGSLLSHRLHIPSSFARAAAFVVILTLTQLLISLLLRSLVILIPASFRDSALNRWAGLVPAAGNAVVLAAILATIAAGLPLPADLRAQLNHSALVSPLIRETSSVGERVFGGAIQDTLNFLTVEPKGDERIELGYTATNVKVDEPAERRMIQLINHERTSRGLGALTLDTGPLRDVVRAHSRDMFARGYFAHENPDGHSPFDRMRSAGVQFLAAGENLALAPDVEIAHQGLMNSPPHKKNILDPGFHRVGIGVVSAGFHGEMFTQDFTD